MAHGGDIQLRNRPQGGLEIVVDLPRNLRKEPSQIAENKAR